MPARTTFRYALGISLPAALIVVGAFAAVLISLDEMADAVNGTETALTRRSAAAGVEAMVRRLGETVGDYAHWDDAARNLYDEPDPVFVAGNIAGSTANPIFFDTAYLVDAKGRDLLAYRLGEPITVPSTVAFGPALSRMLGELPRDGRAYDARSALVTGAWGPAIVAVAPIVPASSDVEVTVSEARFLVVGRPFDAEAIRNLGQDYVIDNLALGEPTAAADSGLALTDFDGKAVAWLVWSPRKLGSAAHARVSPLALAMLGLLALTMVLLVAIAVRGLIRARQSEREARHAAAHDALTGLPNRASLVRRLETAITSMRGGGTAVAVAYLDLDGFKEVNDTFGHGIGDRLLQRVATGFRRLCGDHLLVRLGGDEFAVVVEEANATVIAVEIGERLVDFFGEQLDIDGRALRLSASVGIVGVDSTGISVDELMRRADVAMYRAKHLGRDRICIFEKALDADRIRRMSIAADLRRALAADALSLVYQPVFDALSGKVVCAEALMRWRRASGEIIGPAEFIPIAEETGLIDNLGAWTMRRACRDALAWPGIRVSVNVSPAQFRNPNFVAGVGAILVEVGFPAARLEIELTENYFVSHPEQARSVIDGLRALGLTVALDDFGTGYSSIGYLRRFKFDKLKIDRTLVTRIDIDRQAQDLVQATIHLGRALGLTVTGEGVETEAEAILLRAAGCHEVQGFFFAAPEVASAISARLAAEGAEAGLARTG